MANINELKEYLGYEFSSGPYTGQDYLSFQTKYINYLRSMCRQNSWALVNVGKNHYCFSAFVSDNNGKFVYLSVSDVRGCNNEWYRNILVRTAKQEKDYTGGWNNYTTLPELQSAISRLLLGGTLL